MIMDKSVKDWLQEWCYLIDEERKKHTNKKEAIITSISISINGKDIGETEETNDIIEIEFPKW